MKKKFLVALLTVVFCFNLGACSMPEQSPAFDSKMPWTNSLNYEKSVYTMQKFVREQSGKNMIDGECITTPDSTYTSLLKVDNNGITTVTTELKVTYTDSDKAVDKDFTTGKMIINKNATDTITSTVVFNSALSPMSSTKTVAYGQRSAESFQPIGYEATLDYIAGKMVIKRKLADSEEVKEFDMAKDNRFDNEQLMFVARALKASTDVSSASFRLVSPYDVYLNGSYFRHTIGYSTKAGEPANLNASFSDGRFRLTDTTKKENTGTGGILEPNQEGVYTVDTVQATITLTGNKQPGPAIYYTLSKAGIEFAETLTVGSENFLPDPTQKLILGMRYIEYDLGSARENFNSVYTLKKYTTNPNN